MRNKLLQDPDLIPAAVLIALLVDSNDDSGETVHFKGKTGLIKVPLSTKIVLTVRTQTVEHHKGQISFPGGVFESHDSSLEETALRETHEEIGLKREFIEIIGELPEVPTVATRFRVTPYIGLVREYPEFEPNAHEIGEILLVPLYHLLDATNSVLETYERNGMNFKIRAYHFNSHRIWGATGSMLQTFLEKYIER